MEDGLDLQETLYDGMGEKKQCLILVEYNLVAIPWLGKKVVSWHYTS